MRLSFAVGRRIAVVDKQREWPHGLLNSVRHLLARRRHRLVSDMGVAAIG